MTDTVHPVTAKAVFVTDSGELISNEVLILANKTDDNPDLRFFKEKFTFRNRHYPRSGSYYLILWDESNGLELGRYEFTIDLAFAGDFGI